MLFLGLLSVLGFVATVIADPSISTTIFSTSTELKCYTIITDQSVELPLKTSTSTETTTLAPSLVTSTTTPTITSTALPDIVTSTVLETTIEVVTADASTDLFSTTFTETLTSTDIIQITSFSKETPTTTTTSIKTEMIPTSSGFLPIASTFFNAGIYANSVGSIAGRDALPAGNSTEGNDEDKYDDWDCKCDPPKEYPASVQCTNIVVIVPTVVYTDSAPAETVIVPAPISTAAITLVVTSTYTQLPENVKSLISYTTTVVSTKTTYTTLTETTTMPVSTFVVTQTTSLIAACTASSGNTFGPRYPPNNYPLINYGVMDWEHQYAYVSARYVQVASSYECCADCHNKSDCVGTRYSGTCMQFTDSRCAASSRPGFANQNPTSLNMRTSDGKENNYVLVEVSNGNCGFWFSGGEQPTWTG